MKAGAGKSKGGAFERWTAKQLSLWVTDGKREDALWRSAMSGGRATVMKGKVRQAGDICAVAPEGQALVDYWFIECKSYRNLGVAQFLLCNSGPLAKFWKVACREAVKYKREPMLIAKQNGLPTLVITPKLLGHLALDRCWVGDSFEMFPLDDMLAQSCPWQS